MTERQFDRVQTITLALAIRDALWLGPTASMQAAVSVENKLGYLYRERATVEHGERMPEETK